MANNKIIDLEYIKAFRQRLDDRYIGKNERVSFAELADNLTPYGDNSGIEDDTPFVFQSSGGDSDIGSYSLLEELSGNTIKWNQQAENTNSAWSVSNATKSFSDGVLTFQATQSGGRAYQSFNLINGHTYLCKVCVKLGDISQASGTGTNRVKVIYSLNPSRTDYLAETTEWQYLTRIFTTEADGSLTFPSVQDSTDGPTFYDVQVKEFQFFDLTELFFGNIPSVILNGFDEGPIYNPTTNAKETLHRSGVVAFNRLFPKNAYAKNTGKLVSCKTSEYKIVGFNQFDGVLTKSYSYLWRSTHYIRVIAGQRYTLYANVGYSAEYLECYDYNKNKIAENPDSTMVNSTTRMYVIPSNCAFVQFRFYNADGLTDGNICFNLTWDNSITGYKEYNSSSREMPNVELRRVGNVYDTISPNGVLTRRIGTRAYQSGDENDSSVITDLTNTYYVLEEPTTSSTSSYIENLEIDDWGTQEFVAGDTSEDVIVPQGNSFFYAVDYKAFIDSLGQREDIDYDASEIVSHAELQTAISQIPTGDFGFPIITPPSSTVLTNEQIATITKGCMINGTFLTYENIVFFPALIYSGAYYGTYYVGGRPSRMGTYTILQNGTISITSDNNLRLYGVDWFNGKQVPQYPSSTGTHVLKCVNGTLTWVAE